MLSKYDKGHKTPRLPLKTYVFPAERRAALEGGSERLFLQYLDTAAGPAVLNGWRRTESVQPLRFVRLRAVDGKIQRSYRDTSEPHRMRTPKPPLPEKTACRIYGIKNCATMKKAIAWFEERGLAYEFIDYKKAGVARDRLPLWTSAAGWQALLNTRGLTWKKLSEAERADVDADKALRLMTAYPSLIKRPVIELGDKVVVGFDAERYAKNFAA